jgi:hypothetical protein
MMLQLQLDPEVEAALQEKASQSGVSPEQYVQTLVNEGLLPHRHKDTASKDDLDEIFAKFHEWGKGLPDLPDSAITRETFCEQDHQDIEAESKPERGSPEDMRLWLKSLAERAKDLPHLPTSAFSRESFYERD